MARRVWLFLTAISLATATCAFLPGCVKKEPESSAASTPKTVSTENPAVPLTRNDIDRALQKPLTLKFEKTPLGEVVERLRKELNLPIFIDKTALYYKDVSEETRVTFSCLNMRAKSALRLLMRELDLALIIHDDYLKIASQTEADEAIFLRISDVSDLCEPNGQNGDPLIDLITSSVYPTTWDAVGGPGSISVYSQNGVYALVISQTDEVMEGVEDFLRQLRAIARKDGQAINRISVSKDEIPRDNAFTCKTTLLRNEASIRKALAKPISLHFKDASLESIAKYISKTCNVPAEVDSKIVLGVTKSTESWNAEISDVKLESALSILLTGKEVVWTVRDGKIVFTNAEEAANYLEQKLYDVSDLAAYRDADNQPHPDFDAIIVNIKATISPKTWDTAGGSGDISAYKINGIQALAISQSWAVHDKIAKLFAELRKIRKYPLTKDEIAALPLRDENTHSNNANSNAAHIQPPEDPLRDAVVKSATQFSFDLYSSLRQKEGNVFLSPFGAYATLGMAYAGANGETAKELAAAMRTTSSKSDFIAGLGSCFSDLRVIERKFSAQKSVIRELPFEFSPTAHAVQLSQDGTVLKLSFANGLWIQKGIPLDELYRAALLGLFCGATNSVDLTHPKEVAERINNWAKEQTNGMITDVFSAADLAPEIRAVLINAVYFKEKWAEPFKVAETKEKPFYGYEKELTVPTMNRRGEYLYSESNGVQTLDLPYAFGQFSMTVFLPERGRSAMEKLEDNLSVKYLNEQVKKFEKRDVDVSLPKFQLFASNNFNETLREWGVKQAFDPKTADFSAATGDKTVALGLGLVIQKAFIDVNEEGTEAAAVSGMLGGFGGFHASEKPIVFNADRPFIFLIRDVRTNCILFIGRVEKP